MNHLLRWVAASVFLVAAVPSPRSGVRAAEPPLVMIVSKDTPLTNISTAQLRRTFQGELAEYTSGKRLIPINHPLQSSARVHFDMIVLGLGQTEVGRFWIDRRIRDQSGPPRTVPSAEMALRFVMSMKGSITYVTPEQLNERVRALTVDDKAAGEPGYLLAR
jgi:ABC-type phosphate transport system substrate-binding protein